METSAVLPTDEPDDPIDGHAPRYVIVWAVLVGLTAATWLLARVNLGAFALPVALLIAALKTSLVAVFFMHLLHEHGMTRLSLAIAFIFLAALALLAVADAATRFPLATVREQSVPTHPRPVFPAAGESSITY